MCLFVRSVFRYVCVSLCMYVFRWFVRCFSRYFFSYVWVRSFLMHLCISLCLSWVASLFLYVLRCSFIGVISFVASVVISLLLYVFISFVRHLVSSFLMYELPSLFLYFFSCRSFFLSLVISLCLYSSVTPRIIYFCISSVSYLCIEFVRSYFSCFVIWSGMYGILSFMYVFMYVCM